LQKMLEWQITLFGLRIATGPEFFDFGIDAFKQSGINAGR